MVSVLLLLLLLLPYAELAAGSSPPPAPPCGLRQPQQQPRVVGGWEAVPGQWPWQVSLQLGGQHFCGGTLVAPEWVLTAAHCFLGANGSLAVPGSWRAVAGRLRLQEEGGQEVALAELRLHEAFRGVRGGHDLALARLEVPLKLGPTVGTICLPGPEYPFAYGAPCWITGWGRVAENVSLPSGAALQQVALDLLRADTCNCLHAALRQRRLAHPARAGMLCAGDSQGGRGACQGDSGGPVACLAGGRWVQAGVLSFSLGCGRAFGPALGTDLAAHAAWLGGVLPRDAFAPPPPHPPPPGLEEGKCLGCGMWGGPPLDPLPRGPTWPWAASLRLGRGRQCGGALVGERWVLSAAHCFIGEQTPELWEVSLLTSSQPRPQPRPGSRLHLHGAFVGPGGGHDLALLSFEPPLELGRRLRPLCLPYEGHRSPPGTRCWALLAPPGSSDPQELLSQEVTLGGSCKGPVPPNSLCLTLPPGAPPYQPGPGSPLACLQLGVWFLLGVAAAPRGGGEGSRGAAAPPRALLFTATAPHERWVGGVTREAFFRETPGEGEETPEDRPPEGRPQPTGTPWGPSPETPQPTGTPWGPPPETPQPSETPRDPSPETPSRPEGTLHDPQPTETPWGPPPETTPHTGISPPPPPETPLPTTLPTRPSP